MPEIQGLKGISTITGKPLEPKVSHPFDITSEIGSQKAKDTLEVSRITGMLPSTLFDNIETIKNDVDMWLEGIEQIKGNPEKVAADMLERGLTPPYQLEEAKTWKEWFTRNVPKGLANLAVLPAQLPFQIGYTLAGKPVQKAIEDGAIEGLKEIGLGIVEVERGFGEFLLSPIGYQGYKQWAESGFEGKAVGLVNWEEMKKAWKTDPVFSALALTGVRAMFKKAAVTGRHPTEVINEVKAEVIKTGKPVEEVVKSLTKTTKEIPKSIEEVVREFKITEEGKAIEVRERIRREADQGLIDIIIEEIPLREQPKPKVEIMEEQLPVRETRASRFISGEDIIKQIDRPKQGKQGLTLNPTEIKQLIDYMVEKGFKPKTEAGTIYKPYGYPNDLKPDIIIGEVASGKLVAELSREGKPTGHFRVHATTLEPKEIITRLKPKEMKQLGAEGLKPKAEPVIEPTREGLGEAGFLRIGKEKPLKLEFTGDASKVEGMYEKATEAIKQQRKTNIKKVLPALKRNVVDVSGNIKTALYKQGELGENVIMRHDLIAGATTKAMRNFQAASDRIFRGLDQTGHEYLDRVIQSRRTIAIEKYKKIKHPEGLGIVEHQAWLEQLPIELKTELNRRADLYFKTMEYQLKQLKDEAIITKESYNSLVEKGDYSPRNFLQHIDPEIIYDIGGKKITVRDSGIRALNEGSYGLMEKDSSLLLSQAINRTQNRIFRNRANKALHDLAKDYPDNGVVSLAEGKKTPTGFEKIEVIVDGQAKEMLMPTEMAMEWITKDPILTTTQASIVRWLSGSAILKPMATGLNPEFAMTNFPRDLAHIWITDWRTSYSPHLPVAMGQIAKDLVTVSKDAVLRKGRWKDYIDEGGGMEFLTHQGRITSKTEGVLNDIQTVMGWAGETSEIMPRLALRHRALKKGYIPEKATWIARDYLDFSQGGSFIKALDTGVPYLNASIQGTRGIFRAVAMKPALFTYKVAQVGALATSLYYMNRFLNPDTWEQISPRDKVNNFIITTPFSYKDKEGNKKYLYFKIAKDQGQRVFTSVFEGLAAKSIGDEIDFDQIAQSVQDALPIIPSQNLPPTLDAFVGYAANKDFWRNEDIWRGSEYVEAQEQYTAYTHPAFIKMGDVTGMSPVKLKYSLSQYFTSGNVYTSMGGYAWKLILDEMPEGERQKVTEEIILGQPFIRKIVKHTDPYYKFEKELKEVKILTTTERYKATRDFDILSQKFYDKEATKEQVLKSLTGLPEEETKRLMERFVRRGKIQDLPEKRWWLEVAAMTPEARATVFWNRWRNADKEEKKMLIENSVKVPGFITERFAKRFTELKAKQGKLESSLPKGVSDDMTVNIKAVRDKTGTEVTIKQNAKEAFKESEERVKKYKSLLESVTK